MENLSYPTVMGVRRFMRRPYHQAVDLSIVMTGHRKRSASKLKAMIYEIGDGGVGIEASFPFKPGVMLAFTLGDNVKRGVVKWVNKLDDKKHRAGLAFPTDYTCGMPYPVEFREGWSGVREDLEEYAGALEARTAGYLEALEEISSMCSVPDADEEMIMNKLLVLNEDIFKACAEFEKAAACNMNLIRSQRKAFQKKTSRILSKSVLVRHARTWPQGYQGDYRMLENVYKNTPLSEGFGYYLDRYGLSLPLAKAVRSRVMKLEEIVRQEIAVRNAASALNIACGSCRELMGLAPDIANTGAQFTCIDTDGDALAFAMDRLSLTEAAENITFRKYNAVRMFDDELNMVEFGKMDIIYSVGLFDYLPSDFLARLLGALYRLLHENGTLVAAFKDADQYRHQDFHWLVNWDGFQQRTEKEFLSILDQAGIPRSAIKEERDETGIIIFYLITKK